jgi:nucleoid-associated protein YgaU
VESNEEPPTGLYKHAKKIRQKEKGRSYAWLFILLILLVIFGLIAVWLFFFEGMDRVKSEINRLQSSQSEQQYAPSRRLEPSKDPDPVAVSEPERQVVPAEQIAEPAPVIQAPAAPPAPRVQTVRVRPPAPVSSYNVPAVIPREGVEYRIRWGDTLWDISEAFYRDPWMYPRIARHNNIRNPNLIISGQTIRIPPKS